MCDSSLSEGWYRFVGAAGTKIPTTRVTANRCGTVHPGWLDDTHPTVEDGEASKKVCFSGRSGNKCKEIKHISVKNCGFYFIYNLIGPLNCQMRYCGTDWMPSRRNNNKDKKQKHGKNLPLFDRFIRMGF